MRPPYRSLGLHPDRSMGQPQEGGGHNAPPAASLHTRQQSNRLWWAVDQGPKNVRAYNGTALFDVEGHFRDVACQDRSGRIRREGGGRKRMPDGAYLCDTIGLCIDFLLIS